jgi:hypothetical protein
MKLYYFNDRLTVATVYVNDFHSTPKMLQPAEGDYFEVELNENSIPFIKTWETNIVLISFMEELEFEDIEVYERAK